MGSNQWGPRNGEELLSDIYQRLRILDRNRARPLAGSVPDAIDASGGEDILDTIDFYVEGQEQYVIPPEPAVGSLPPQIEDASPAPAVFGAGSGSGISSASASTITTPSGYPSFSDWALSDMASLGMTTPGDHTFILPNGVYVGKINLNLTVTPTASDFTVGVNLFDSSAWVTQEFVVPVIGGGVNAGYTVGPFPIDDDHGVMGVSFFFPVTAGSPTVSGSCDYIIARLS